MTGGGAAEANRLPAKHPLYSKSMARHGVDFRLRLPHRRFHRRIGVFSTLHCDPEGRPLDGEEWERRRHEFLPSAEDRAYVRSLMQPVTEPGKIANWIAPPRRGIDGKPFAFEYVRRG